MSLAKKDEYYMRHALELAAEAMASGDVPVGAVVVSDDCIVATGKNTREDSMSPLGHAELNAISMAAAKLKTWRLDNATLYVTLEPCLMCAGAIVQSRLKRLVYGTSDPKGGMVDSVAHVFDWPSNHRPEITSGVLETECKQQLRDFFDAKRKKL